jgi:uncharacterized protein
MGMDHTVVHFEIPADDGDALARFYTELFGWRIEKLAGPMGFWWIDPGGGMPKGGMPIRQHPGQQPINYIGVECIDTYVKRAEGLGAKVTVPKTAVDDVGWMAWIIDPQGNAIAMFQPARTQ